MSTLGSSLILANGQVFIRSLKSSKFQQVSFPASVVSVALGYDQCNLVITEDGSIWSWGNNCYGQLGHVNNNSPIQEPTRIPNTDGFVSVAAGSRFSMALHASGQVYCFGANYMHQLGLEHSNACFVPTLNPFLTNIKKIDAAHNHGVSLDCSGKVWYFGDSRTTPTLLEGVDPIVDISCGYEKMLLLDRNACVWSFNLPSERLEKIQSLENVSKNLVCWKSFVCQDGRQNHLHVYHQFSRNYT
jgi:hypothetical protein